MLLPTEKNKVFRIALLGIYHESNTFVPGHTTLDKFKQGRWLIGQQIVETYREAHHELGGAIEVFSKNKVELAPVFYAETTPGGVVTAEAFDELTRIMMEELEKNFPVDACYVVPHGAAVAANHRDMDGTWLAMLRKSVGDQVPIVGTLDPHANVSPLMINSTTALFPYSTNPHLDQRATGKKAAEFLLDILNQTINPLMHLLQVPVAISIEQQETAVEPCLGLYQFANELTKTQNILHVNIALGFPYADVHEMGTSVIVITNNDKQASILAAEQMCNYFLRNKQCFVSKKESITTIVDKIRENPKPVLLLDMGDNVGGGADGSSTYLLEALDNTQLHVFTCVYSPAAVDVCTKHQLQEKFPLVFGANPETGEGYESTVTLISRHEGRFTELEARHGGQVNYHMGPAFIIVNSQENTILIHSRRVPPFSLAQLTSCNIRPEDFDVIIAKGVVAPIAAYGPVCNSVIRVNSPGLTQADATKLSYKHRRKPLYPFE